MSASPDQVPSEAYVKVKQGVRVLVEQVLMHCPETCSFFQNFPVFVSELSTWKTSYHFNFRLKAFKCMLQGPVMDPFLKRCLTAERLDVAVDSTVSTVDASVDHVPVNGLAEAVRLVVDNLESVPPKEFKDFPLSTESMIAAVQSTDDADNEDIVASALNTESATVAMQPIADASHDNDAGSPLNMESTTEAVQPTDDTTDNDDTGSAFNMESMNVAVPPADDSVSTISSRERVDSS